MFTFATTSTAAISAISSAASWITFVAAKIHNHAPGQSLLLTTRARPHPVSVAARAFAPAETASACARAPPHPSAAASSPSSPPPSLDPSCAPPRRTRVPSARRAETAARGSARPARTTRRRARCCTPSARRGTRTPRRPCSGATARASAAAPRSRSLARRASARRGGASRARGRRAARSAVRAGRRRGARRGRRGPRDERSLCPTTRAAGSPRIWTCAACRPGPRRSAGGRAEEGDGRRQSKGGTTRGVGRSAAAGEKRSVRPIRLDRSNVVLFARASLRFDRRRGGRGRARIRPSSFTTAGHRTVTRSTTRSSGVVCAFIAPAGGRE
eukprot:29507-Pelagococcus_subviridis.AAC.8